MRVFTTFFVMGFVKGGDCHPLLFTPYRQNRVTVTPSNLPLRKIYVDFCTKIWWYQNYFVPLPMVRITGNTEE